MPPRFGVAFRLKCLNFVISFLCNPSPGPHHLVVPLVSAHFIGLPSFSSVLYLTSCPVPFRRLLRPLKEIRTMAFRLTECCADFLSDGVPIFLDGGC